MGTLSFHLHILHHHHHGHHQQNHHGRKDIPKGCLAVMVGLGEEQQRFVIPVMYINHPLFVQLLKEAEEEYGFDQDGPIKIPCRIEEFRQVQDKIDEENSHHHRHHHSQHRHNHHHSHSHSHNLNHNMLCF